MIKWPEPDMIFPVVAKNSPWRGHSEAQLKQAVRDALKLAVDTCESTLYVEGDGTVSVYGPKTSANTEIRKCRDAIRALIEEIPA